MSCCCTPLSLVRGLRVNVAFSGLALDLGLSQSLATAPPRRLLSLGPRSMRGGWQVRHDTESDRKNATEEASPSFAPDVWWSGREWESRTKDLARHNQMEATHLTLRWPLPSRPRPCPRQRPRRRRQRRRQQLHNVWPLTCSGMLGASGLERKCTQKITEWRRNG